ncbi:hypothetical protein BDW02DRAFT_647691 [Decorospora gaudefroyi]|uniref:Inner centromere protein ARK-binding domain-containing protein n=1 Tax=Decorospora gaudefroyi TaxID=184978 RepID=A0A6A5KFL1_9PLEO|nr:hypothetical protein BDW02DRAFT_647691 [Decorospora gaudefroyi]
MAARSKAPTVGSAGWILEERHQSNTLVSQELEDFSFSVRNELEWLNEHLFDMLASDGQHNLDVFKTPGKLRGKTPRTARKKAVDRQPLASIPSANAQNQPSAAEQSLRSVKARFQIAEDSENTVRQSPITRTPIARQLFTKAPSAGKENVDNSVHGHVFDKPSVQPLAAPWSPLPSTQDTVMTSQPSDVFSPPRAQSTQNTQATASFRHSFHDQEERRDTGDSFVSANEAFASKNASKDNLRAMDADAMDVDVHEGEKPSDAPEDTMIHHEVSSDAEQDEEMHDIPDFPDPPRVVPEQYSISAEIHDALETANSRALAPEPKNLFPPEHSTTPVGPPPVAADAVEHDDTVLHHQISDQMDIDDVRSPSDNSSPVKPLVRKSSLTFASLPAREPLLSKKSMGNRVSRTSHVDPSKGRNSQMGRFTGGKSLGGSQMAHPAEMHHADDMDLDIERPELQREESETTKTHNKTSTQRLFERINMLKQQNEAPKPSQPQPQPQSFSTKPKENAPITQNSQPAYPNLAAPEVAQEEDDDDDWISPVRTAAPAPAPARPAFSKSHTTNACPSPPKPVPSKLVSVSNPDLSAAMESTTPVGSPTSKKYMDGPLSASKSKLYSAFRAAKEKLIGSNATSAQAKLDALKESPARPKPYTHSSSDDVFSSPKRTEKPTTMFSHGRSPSKDSNKSSKSSKSGKSAAMSSSPLKSDGRRTRSSTEREKQKEKETQEREVREARQQQRADDKLKQMREKEQNRAAAQHQKARAMGAKTPVAMSSQSSLRQPTATTASKTPAQTAPPPQQVPSRPAIPRSNTASSREQDVDSADEMPPPPPPKSLLPTTKTSKAPLREPRKITKPSSKDALPKVKAPQKIMVNLKSSQYGQAPPPAARPAPTSSKPLPAAPQTVGKSAASVPRQPPAASTRPASALSTRTAASSKTAQPMAKPAAPRVARPQPQAMEKPKVSAPQPRADLGASRPVSRMQTVQDANRINIPPINPAKPPKRQLENDETLHRPAKRPSQQAKNLNPITPAHSQFAKGKIPFAESAHPPQPQIPQIQYPNGDDIKLPEIMTDSEDEDSENEFEQPSWVNTPNLREMLSNQQLMDPEHIFGPIAPLEMEKVFPNKERHKRFRERTSSAFWANDEVTAEEKRKEREARERLVRDGAWSYNPSPRPTQPGPSR